MDMSRWHHYCWLLLGLFIVKPTARMCDSQGLGCSPVNIITTIDSKPKTNSFQNRIIVDQIICTYIYLGLMKTVLKYFPKLEIVRKYTSVHVLRSLIL